MVSDLLAPKPDYQTTPVSVLPASGPAPAGLVVTTSKPWYDSVTIWSGLSMLGGGVLDSIVSVLLPVLVSDAPVSFSKLWRPCLVAALGAVMAYRRKTDNQVIQ